MKQTNINIDEIKRYPTVTNPIKADDLHTPQAYAYTLRRAIVTDCNDRQRAELVKLLEGKDTAEGVTFNNTKLNRDRLHIWQNSESRKQRAAILGEGWQYIEGLNSGTEPGDLITCLDGTRGRVTKSDGESCVIEFETENGQRLTVAGYFRYTPSEKLRNSESKAPAATYETSATADEQQQADALPFMEKAAILDKVTARIYAPWGDVSKMWLCPFRGANDVWNAWARRYNFRDFGRLAEWALTAKVGERAEYRGLLVQIWERDGQTAADPESEADRLTANRETRERLRAAIVAELEAVGAYLYPFDNEMKVFGKIQTAAELSKVEDIARRYSSAQFRHEDRAAVFEFNLPLFFPHYFPTDPTPDPSGEGVGVCHSFEQD